MNARNRIDCPNYHKIILKKATKSNVWQFFGLPADENGKIIHEYIAICNLCQRAVSSKATSNLWSHLKHHHALHYQNLNPGSNIHTILHEASNDVDEDDIPMQTFATGYSSQIYEPNPNCSLQNYESNSGCSSLSYESDPGCSSQSYKIRPSSAQNLAKVKSLLHYDPLDNNSAKECTLAITKFLAVGMQPFSLVEDDSFKQMVKILNPRYTLPGRKYFSNNSVPKLYIEVVEKLKEILPKSSSISITCDCWTSLAGQPYIAITAHFIDFNWNLISACLSCSYFEENHTAYNIKSMIENKLEEWGLNSECIVSCTTDNGTNIINAVDLLKIICIPCFAHSINIGVNRCLEIQQVKKAVGHLKSLQNSIVHSWKMKKELKEVQELLQLNVKTLPNACPTRWSSTLKLCKRFLENQVTIRKMLQSFPAQKHLMPDGCEVLALESFVKVVAILQEVTDTLAGENFLTSSAVLPLMRQIKKNLTEITDDTILLKSLKEKVLSPLVRYEAEIVQKILCLSTFVDPRFRLHFFDDNVKVKVKQTVIDELKTLHTKDLIPVTVNSPPKKKKKGLVALLGKDEDCTDNTQDKDAKEVEKYLSMPKVDIDDDPILWWKHYTSSFPGLSVLARKYLCIQGSSVPFERIFNKEGYVINKNRCTLSPKNAEMQVFLSYNKKILEKYL